MSEYDDAPESPFGLTMKETDAGELRLMFEPDDFRFKIDATGLRHMAIEKGFGELDFDENALAVAAQHIGKNEAFVSTIANRRNAEYRVYISADRLVAQLQVTPSYGGTPISVDAARALRMACRSVEPSRANTAPLKVITMPKKVPSMPSITSKPTR